MYGKFYFLNFVNLIISSFHTSSAEIKLLILLGCITINTILCSFFYMTVPYYSNCICTKSNILNLVRIRLKYFNLKLNYEMQ